MRRPPPTPTPIPVFAPVERPLLGVGVDALAAGVVAAAAADVVAGGLVIDACLLGDDEGIADDTVIVG
jgi:hypothetical protein